ncbi:hypothetical protein Rfer_1054 [Rhodoferax ferrireducens T118]|uniref:Transposase n=1 Tax=Albidiferax ferrireducens (strain ATCC BAA-621 / DSM 15236 / T118) TaxID=338969 RepID=Q21ZK8_ALBFT|nr:hypothetical protein [Rhodoferax ferrireducens]ABD68795.1 hypothetical protein Rfer_1054 [Rhodoferax ferrireducens T118]
MHIGTQLTAPNGWGDWAKNERYYFSGTHEEQVLIVSFFIHDDAWRVSLRRVPKETFEDALTGSARKILRIQEQFALPPWLQLMEDVDFDSREKMRYKKKKGEYVDTVKTRRTAIEPLLKRQSEILGSDNPLAQIAKIGRECSPTQHPHRLQLWFFAFILHGKHDWALNASQGLIGQWKRDYKKYGLKKFGRTYKDEGTQYGWSSIHFRQEVETTYLSYCGQYKSMMSIYNRAMLDDFGCEVQKHNSGGRSIYQPNNHPYPSYSQYRKIVVDAFGLDAVQTAIYGHVRMRNKATVNEGCYVDQFKNLLESIEVDAYRCDDRAHAAFSDEAMPALIVARAICVKTGAVVGVGFSLGGEKREAYRSMLLCMALPKSLVAKLYGIPEKMLDWPMSGMSPSMLSDRGPAGFESLLDDLEEKIPIKSGAPSYQPRSKPFVEGSNPKSVLQEGAPSFILSDLDLPSMMRREIMRAVKQNRSKDISSHLSEQEIVEFNRLGLTATPQAYWGYLSDRLRTSGYSMLPNQAVKAFCKPIKLAVDRTGVLLYTRHYSSETFRSEGLHALAARVQPKGLKGYCIPLATRYIWMEFAGKLIDLEALKSGSSNGEDYFIPLSVLEDLGKALAELQSRTRKSGRAANIEVEQEFKELTGKAWDAGTSRSGTPKRGRGTVAHEVAVMNDKIRVGAR